MIIGDKGK